MTPAARYGLLLVGILLTVASALCIATPVLWHLQGYPGESYPELFALAFLLPNAVVALAAGAVWALSRKPWRRYATAIFWAGAVLAVAQWLIMFANLASGEPATGFFIDLLGSVTEHHFLLLLAFASIAAGGWLVRRQRR